MTHDEMIAVIQAAKEGKEIEWKYVGQNDGWNPLVGSTQGQVYFDFRSMEYRVKPEPVKPRQLWINEYVGATPETPRLGRNYFGEPAKAIAMRETGYKRTVLFIEVPSCSECHRELIGPNEPDKGICSSCEADRQGLK